MKRLVVLLAVSAGLSSFGAIACGGNDKPPLTPDTVEPPTEATEAGAPAAPTAAPAATK